MRLASIAACIVSMPNWGRIPKINLTSRFRNQYDLELAKFVEDVANGAVKSEKNAEGYPQILLPPHLIKPFTNTTQALDWFMGGTPCSTQRVSQNKAILRFCVPQTTESTSLIRCCKNDTDEEQQH